MAKAEWILTEGASKVAQGSHAQILALVRERDPFISQLRDGANICGYTVGRVVAEPVERSDSERDLRAFTLSLHKQIHDAADAAHRCEYNKSRRLLLKAQERLNHYLGRH
ncbi:MAG: hypothetical protein DCO99_03600 [Synechococcus sp. XM-24]|nr:MAG: hypothetical protein DCO99_03600 [Synechococcus sp. XM-24]